LLAGTLISEAAPERQPEIAPLLAEKMKFAVPPVIRKLLAMPPATMPVGLPSTWTTVLLTAPVAGMIVDVLVPSFAGHHGDPALLVSPHALTMFLSSRSACTFVRSLETML
jgi:hypothetical protein